MFCFVLMEGEKENQKHQAKENDDKIKNEIKDWRKMIKKSCKNIK